MAFSDTLKSIVGTVAPMLGTALGGPLGGLAGKLLQDKLGVDSNEAALEQLQSNPEALIRVKELEGEFKTRMRELGIREQQLHAADRDSARDLAKSRGVLVQGILTTVFVVGYFALIYVLLTSGLTAGLTDWDKGQLGILIGVLTAAIHQMFNFWFGSSRGSKDKTDALSDAARQSGRG